MGISYRVIVIGGGHAGVEAAWSAARRLASDSPRRPGMNGSRPAPAVALVTIDPARTGVMSCNPAIGGLAKGQIVREIDALGGLMGLVADATGIQFKVLNATKGPAVHGPRCQSDKHAYARAVQMMLHTRDDIDVIAGTVDELLINGSTGRCVGVRVGPATSVVGSGSNSQRCKPEGESHAVFAPFVERAIRPESTVDLRAEAVVLTTGTFMRGLMHTGEEKTPGGRFGEAPAEGLTANLRKLGFELGRLKTGTPPRLKRSTIDWDALPDHPGDAIPTPLSDLSAHPDLAERIAGQIGADVRLSAFPSLAKFPVLKQVVCKQTSTDEASHELIRANLHRAPMFTGQIESAGPRYCPSIEDKVVRFADRASHNVYLEPESLHDDWIYCNGISTSLPADVQDGIVRRMRGCENAHIYRYGYAVEYDMVLPHQIHATGETKLVDGLYLAGQINGTSGYEEAAGQGVVAGINAAGRAMGIEPVVFGREEAYIGVLMDDLVTKTPREPYRMFTSRAEHRLLLRSDNAADRLTPIAQRLGLLDDPNDPLAEIRRTVFAARTAAMNRLNERCTSLRIGERTLADLCRRPGYEPADLERDMRGADPSIEGINPAVLWSVHTGFRYEAYIQRARAEVRRHAEIEHRRIPTGFTPALGCGLRAEACDAINRFRPETFGQAARLEGITPADLTLLSVLVRRFQERKHAAETAG